MLDVLSHTTYRRLFAAQVIALVGTGLATVALGLLAYDLAGDRAGVVLGTALAIKMVAYILVAPVVGAFAARFPRRGFLVTMDLVRLSVVVCLPFVTAVWQVYLLIVVLQVGSAAFTPTFQATIPEVLPDEEDYTAALSLSRLAYDLEALLSPLLAAALLTVVSFDLLFAGTAAGFALSAVLVRSVSLPTRRGVAVGRGWARTTRGARIYLATPRLRGLLALNLAVAAGGALVIVNTVLYVRDELGRGAADVAIALGAYGAGSMAAAIAVPRLLRRTSERRLMLAGAVLSTAGLLAGIGVASAGAGTAAFGALLALWALLGAGGSLVLTPSGRLLRRSARADDLPALFAAQFALSHVCWLVAYLLAAHLVVAAGFPATFAALAGLALAGIVVALRVWPASDPAELEHVHRDLPRDHPHLADADPVDGGWGHAHGFVIDDEHTRWPSPATRAT